MCKVCMEVPKDQRRQRLHRARRGYPYKLVQTNLLEALRLCRGSVGILIEGSMIRASAKKGPQLSTRAHGMYTICMG